MPRGPLQCMTRTLLHLSFNGISLLHEGQSLKSTGFKSRGPILEGLYRIGEAGNCQK